MNSDGPMSGSRLREWIEIICEHSGMTRSELREVAQHGVDAGWPGFTYYTDCSSFVEEHREEIMEVIAWDANQLGMSIPEFMTSWRDSDQIVDGVSFDTALAWYVLERVARKVVSTNGG